MPKIKRRLLIASSLSIILLLGVGTLVLLSPSARAMTRISFETTLAHLYSAPTNDFPDISQDNLNDVQRKIVTLSRQEYQKKPVSFDAHVLAYSQGYKEPWCADFVSWIMKNAGVPLSNPHSGSWRIPGVNTMQEYYQSDDRYKSAGTYKPKVGDVAMYTDARSHVNIVIAVNEDTMTTVGGNETGHLRINTQSFKQGVDGLSGFGTQDM